MRKHVYPKRAIWRELLKMAWERGEYRWAGRLSGLLAITALQSGEWGQLDAPV